jgi:hypothetical protein
MKRKMSFAKWKEVAQKCANDLGLPDDLWSDGDMYELSEPAKRAFQAGQSSKAFVLEMFEEDLAKIELENEQWAQSLFEEAMSLKLLRDFADAYAEYNLGVRDRVEETAVRLTELAVQLLGYDSIAELEAFQKAQEMLLDGDLADEDRPMVERLRANAALRFARKLALLLPTEKDVTPRGQ